MQEAKLIDSTLCKKIKDLPAEEDVPTGTAAASETDRVHSTRLAVSTSGAGKDKHKDEESSSDDDGGDGDDSSSDDEKEPKEDAGDPEESGEESEDNEQERQQRSTSEEAITEPQSSAKRVRTLVYMGYCCAHSCSCKCVVCH